MLRDFLVFLVSPTRFAIERFHTHPVRVWNWIFRVVSAGYIVALGFTQTLEAFQRIPYHLGYVLLWALPFSRINELAIAFYYDAIERFEGLVRPTSREAIERIKLILAAYFEIAAQFGVLYFCLFPSGTFTRNFRSIIEAIYFSVVTIGTVGYGDITPRSPWAQITIIYELAVGFLIVAFALGSYLATTPIGHNDDQSPKSMKQ